jgi:uncharacterized membrane protein (TIGR02234 family)
MAEPDQPAGSDRREVAAVVLATAVGGGVGVLATARAWSTVVVTRLPPLGPVRHDVTGRTLQPGVTGLAVVALAGVLAVLATRGVTRRVIGAVLTLAGAGMVWWSLTGLSAVSATRGRQLVADARTAAGLGTASATNVTVHPAWVLLAALGGLLVAAGGVTTAARGGRWRAMSARYESPVATTSVAPGPSPGDAIQTGPGVAIETGPGEVARARADLALWHQLDRGEDPTDIASGAAPPARTDPIPPGGTGDALGR